MNQVATLCFALAILHTFSVKWFRHRALRYPEGSAGENIFHLLGEVEVVFGLWAGILLSYLGLSQGPGEVTRYLEGRNFTEPAFVFVILTVCSTRPILELATGAIDFVSKWVPLPRMLAFYGVALALGPILGSFITEPAAMTVTALVLLQRVFVPAASLKLKYATLGLLFVNVSIGGTLTPYAAPPVLMVAPGWGWDLGFMLSHFGWKAVLAILASTAIVAFRFRREITALSPAVAPGAGTGRPIPPWVTGSHLLALVAIVFSGHSMVVFVGIFLFFLGLVSVTREYHQELKLREGLLVGFFLGGIVVLGGPQRWWLEPILTRLETLPLYLSAMSLTAITDNAALTYLGSQVPGLSDASKYALVAGSVVGGGLTVIANAPNPAGYGILSPAFGGEGISSLQLLLAALLPTAIAAVCFWVL